MMLGEAAQLGFFSLLLLISRIWRGCRRCCSSSSSSSQSMLVFCQANTSPGSLAALFGVQDIMRLCSDELRVDFAASRIVIKINGKLSLPNVQIHLV